MDIRSWLYHKHYWGVPHRRDGDGQTIQICYECGKERVLTIDLRSSDDVKPGNLDKGLTFAKQEKQLERNR